MGEIGPDVVLDAPAFVHPTVCLYGAIHIGRDVSIWPYVVMRAEAAEVRIGARSNVQDHVMVHFGGGHPVIVGENCSITHHVTLHGCEIGDDCLIGINATVMDGARIGRGSIVAGHSIVTEGSEFPEFSVIAGVPAKLVATRDNTEANRLNAQWYHENALRFARGVHRMPEAD